jgi:branched-chain amino acid transport system ATP-binding protein
MRSTWGRAVLEVAGLRASYGNAEVLRGVSFAVGPGEVVAIVGGNGAGKSTLARSICGIHRARNGVVRLHDQDLGSCTTVEVARAGITLVPQGRRLFGSLTVAEHLTVAGLHRRPHAMTKAQVIELFPRLGERLRVRGRSLSGGEQQMLAIARAVLLGPDVLVMDEPTEGLAPAVVDLVGALIRHLRERGAGIVLMEQDGWFPREVADRTLIIDRGLIRPASSGRKADAW